MKFLFLFLSSVLLIACQPYTPPLASKENLIPLTFQPFHGIDSTIAREVYSYIKTTTTNPIQVLPEIKLPTAAYNNHLKRYKADSILSFMRKGRGEENRIMIGLVSTDIETSLEGREHWGIMGLGYCPGKAAVISTYRLRKGAVSSSVLVCRAINVCIHEMGHNFSLPHCSDKNCVMRAARGRLPSDTIGQFCPECLQTLHQKGWKYEQPPTTYSQHTENK